MASAVIGGSSTVFSVQRGASDDVGKEAFACTRRNHFRQMDDDLKKSLAQNLYARQSSIDRSQSGSILKGRCGHGQAS
jgi:hypothetical protein